MALTTGDEIREIINGCTLTDEQIDPFLLSAHVYLNTVFAGDVTLGNTIRREIERWYVAHMLISTGYQQQQTVKREKVGDAELEYVTNTVTGQGLVATPYGQMALQLDTTGLLAKAGKQKATIYAIKSFDELED